MGDVSWLEHSAACSSANSDLTRTQSAADRKGWLFPLTPEHRGDCLIWPPGPCDQIRLLPPAKLTFPGSALNFLLVAGPSSEKDSVPMSTDSSADTHGSPRQFVTTRWSLILTSVGDGSDKTEAHDALAQLCRIYWRPIYSFICARGYSISDAQD